jgi:hypothetical protein
MMIMYAAVGTAFANVTGGFETRWLAMRNQTSHADQ